MFNKDLDPYSKEFAILHFAETVVVLCSRISNFGFNLLRRVWYAN